MNMLVQDRILLLVSSIVLASVLTGLSYLSSSNALSPAQTDAQAPPVSHQPPEPAAAVVPMQSAKPAESLTVLNEATLDADQAALPELPRVTPETFQSVEGMNKLFAALDANFPDYQAGITSFTEIDKFGNSITRCENYDEYVMSFYRQMLDENLALTIEFHNSERWDDYYFYCAILMHFNGANIRELIPVLTPGQYYLFDIGITHDLHIQEPELYLAQYRHVVAEGEDSISPDFMVGIAEILRGEALADFRTKVITSRHPSNYIYALEQLGDDALPELVEQMWQTHKANDYPPRKSGETDGRHDRASAAVNYGIEEAWDELYELLKAGFFVEDIFRYHLKLDDPKSSFPLVRDRLEYDAEKRRWRVAPVD